MSLQRLEPFQGSYSPPAASPIATEGPVVLVSASTSPCCWAIVVSWFTALHPQGEWMC